MPAITDSARAIAKTLLFTGVSLAALPRSVVVENVRSTFHLILRSALLRVSKDGCTARTRCHPSRRPPIEIGCCRFRRFNVAEVGQARLQWAASSGCGLSIRHDTEVIPLFLD